MNIRIVCVGKPHDKTLETAIADYQKRLPNYIHVSWHYVPTSSKETESQKMLTMLDGYVVLLDETGTSLTSPEFANKLQDIQNNSYKTITCIIGGPYGVTTDVQQKADFVWSLSNLVFPHQIVRLLLAEQLYRAYDILGGGNYHHA